MLQHTTFYCLMEFSGEKDNSLVPNNSCFSSPCPRMISVTERCRMRPQHTDDYMQICLWSSPSEPCLAERSKLSYSVLTAQMLPGSQALFSSGCLLQEKLKKKKQKTTSLHWAYIDYFFPEDLFLSLVLDRKISKSSQGPARKHLGLSSYTSGPMTPFFKCIVCILGFSWYELKIIALSISVIDSTPRFLNQLFREWPFRSSSHLNRCLHLKVFRHRIILSQCITV